NGLKIYGLLTSKMTGRQPPDGMTSHLASDEKRASDLVTYIPHKWKAILEVWGVTLSLPRDHPRLKIALRLRQQMI
ncbi:hypothetical protein HAX54_036363, partial [Datura stramonium]|nr:hypothetical protein [Datura stramonium]